MDLHVRSSGSGDAGTIVFLHGFPFDSSVWEKQLTALPKGWRGIAPDLRGFGRSPLGAAELHRGGRSGAGIALGDEAVLTMDDLAADVDDLIRREVDGPVVICGLSMGGYVAFALLRRAPELCRGLVLMDTRAEPDTDEGRENRRRMAAMVRESGARPIAAAMLPGLLSPGTRDRDSDVAAHVRRMIEGTAPRTIVAALAGMAARHDSTSDLARISVPTLVVVGAEDSVTPPSAARRMAEAVPDARLEVIQGAAHLPCLEAPGVINDLLVEYLQTL